MPYKNVSGVRYKYNVDRDIARLQLAAAGNQRGSAAGAYITIDIVIRHRQTTPNAMRATATKTTTSRFLFTPNYVLSKWQEFS